MTCCCSPGDVSRSSRSVTCHHHHTPHHHPSNVSTLSLYLRRGAVGRVSDLRRGFESRPGTWRKNSGQVYHTYVPLSPSSISWYQPKGGDALRLGVKAGMVRLWVAGKTV